MTPLHRPPPLLSSSAMSSKEEWSREGKKGEVELTSSTSWRSVRTHYHIHPIKALNIFMLSKGLRAFKQQLENNLFQDVLSPCMERCNERKR